MNIFALFSILRKKFNARQCHVMLCDLGLIVNLEIALEVGSSPSHVHSGNHWEAHLLWPHTQI
jgi:hypothetical protein